METIKMNTTTNRAPVAFAVTNDNAFVLLAHFRRAALNAGWTETQVEETAARAMSGNYHHLQCTLAAYTVEYRTNS